MLRVLLAVSTIAVLALNRAGIQLRSLPFPPPTELRLAADDAVTNASLLTLGMRRLATDIMLIRTMVYYGTKEEEMSLEYRKRVGLLQHKSIEHDHNDGHDHGHHHGDGGDPRFEKIGYLTSRGVYPELQPKGLRMLGMDPYWKYPVLFVAGALAFNQDRPHEAVELLRAARRYMPDEDRYLAYTAAIAFHKKGDMQEVINELSPLLADEDTPTMIKNMVAYMNVRLGDKKTAIRLYKEILNSRDDRYHSVARGALTKLGVATN
ncbi:MAG: hypothetical protein ABIJ96_15055 [Elusimicrobiota bacterium]